MNFNNVCVVIPAYNEEQRLGEVLKEMCQYDFKIIVVDDGSLDKTSHIAQQYPVHSLRHITNVGQGAALQTGMDYAFALNGLDYLITFDADGQHKIANIPDLIKTIESCGCDVVLGSRFCKGGKAHNIRFIRKITLLIALWITKLITGLHITDTHNGLRCFTISAAKKINITQNRMAHASEILDRISKLQLKYCEVPVEIAYTQYSLSKGQRLIDAFDIIFDLIRKRF